jgi:transcriptional regulator with XRE-family HTH domain
MEPQRTYRVLVARRPEIRRVREDAGIKVRALARKIGRPEYQVRHVLQGAKINNSIAEAVADFFGVPVSALFFELDLEHLPAAPLTLPSPARGEDSGSERRNAA